MQRWRSLFGRSEVAATGALLSSLQDCAGEGELDRSRVGKACKEGLSAPASRIGNGSEPV